MSSNNFSNFSNEHQLGSLAQSARTGQLKSARIVLIIVGILLILGQVLEYFLFVDGILAQHEGTQEEKEFLRLVIYIAEGVVACIGLLFIVLGVIVYRYPVFCTILGLVLYSMIALLTGFQGIILKAIIIYALFRAVQTALAYQKEVKESTNNLY